MLGGRGVETVGQKTANETRVAVSVVNSQCQRLLTLGMLDQGHAHYLGVPSQKPHEPPYLLLEMMFVSSTPTPRTLM